MLRRWFAFCKKFSVMKEGFNWINIGESQPDHRSVLLCKEQTNDILKIKIGAIVTRDDGVQGWFIGNDTKVVTLASYIFWTYLEETDLGVVQAGNDDLLQNEVEEFLQKLRLFDGKFQILGKEMMYSGKGLYPLDYYITGVLNRACSLIYGFETLITTMNFISAAHLVRLHLDSYLRLSAGWLAKDPHDFSNRVLNGEPVRKIKDSDGHWMTDAYLKEKAAKTFPWIKDVYEETSGFIHFSSKHILNSISDINKERSTVTTTIGKTDINVSNLSRLEAIICMIEICNAIAVQVDGWIETKRMMG